MNRQFKMGLGVAAMTATLSAGIFVGEALASQPHMQAALDALTTARSELQMASRNKGGHRIEALRLTNEAIRETQLGIDAGGE